MTAIGTRVVHFWFSSISAFQNCSKFLNWMKNGKWKTLIGTYINKFPEVPCSAPALFRALRRQCVYIYIVSLEMLSKCKTHNSTTYLYLRIPMHHWELAGRMYLSKYPWVEDTRYLLWYYHNNRDGSSISRLEFLLMSNLFLKICLNQAIIFFNIEKKLPRWFGSF